MTENELDSCVMLSFGQDRPAVKMNAETFRHMEDLATYIYEVCGKRTPIVTKADDRTIQCVIQELPRTDYQPNMYAHDWTDITPRRKS